MINDDDFKRMIFFNILSIRLRVWNAGSVLSWLRLVKEYIVRTMRSTHKYHYGYLCFAIVHVVLK